MNANRGVVARMRFVLAAWVAGCALAASAADLTMVGATLYATPDAAPMHNASIVVGDGRILSVVPGTPRETRGPVIDVAGRVVVAGFWNSHVHLLADAFHDAAHAPREPAERTLREIFTSRGFTTVFDVASPPGTGTAMRTRIARGEIDGPLILTVDSPFYPQRGTPIYVRDLHRKRNWPSAEVSTPAEAQARAVQQLDAGADGVKLFVGAIVGPPNGVISMRIDIASAAVREAHAHGKPAFAHPTDVRGVRIALAAGVDVLTHTTAGEGPWAADLVDELVRRRVALVPTLALFELELARENAPSAVRQRFERDGAQQVLAFTRAGGTLLFGTDVGYLPEADTAPEFRLLAKAGLDWRAILASLTTAPATRFGFATRKGRVEPGYDADLVVLAADPSLDPLAFSRVHMTVRGGRVLYRHAEAPPR